MAVGTRSVAGSTWKIRPESGFLPGEDPGCGQDLLRRCGRRHRKDDVVDQPGRASLGAPVADPYRAARPLCHRCRPTYDAAEYQGIMSFFVVRTLTPLMVTRSNSELSLLSASRASESLVLATAK